ncbi:MAG: RnfH family protein, partial [Pontibacterium sp.]
AKAISNPKKTALKEGDRIELYRPLIADPKEARAKRAAKMKAEKEKQ